MRDTTTSAGRRNGRKTSPIPLVVVAAVLLAALLLVWRPWSGTAGDDGALDLPRRMPDVVGESLEDGLDVLSKAGYPEVLLFTTDVHAADPWEGIVDTTLPIGMTLPEPRDPSVPTVLVWVGERPDIPANVPSDAWYYPHSERIAARGTDLCLVCHERDFCDTCHEERLEQSDALLRSDPADAPTLTAAVSSAIGIDVGLVLAVDRGSGWYQVDILLYDPEDPRVVADSAREDAVLAVPAAFEAEPEAETLVLRWVDADTSEPFVEIGFERSNYGSWRWDDIGPSDIPWIADRYAVPSR